ncbi:hypothetical protein FOL47_010079, partial [Perkinsus chesapeaki]
MIKAVHEDLLHCGVMDVEVMLKKLYSRPRMTEDIKRVISACDNNACECNRASVSPFTASSPRRLATGKWVCVACDVFHYEKLPILSVIDEYSRFACLYILSEERAVLALQALQQIFEIPFLGYPLYLRSDRGIFTSLREPLKNLGVLLILTSGHRPQANGIVERLHYTLRLRLATLSKDLLLSDRLKTVINAYNRCPHSSLNGVSPAESLSGRSIRTRFCIPVKVPSPEVPANMITFQKGQLVWLLKPQADRRA